MLRESETEEKPDNGKNNNDNGNKHGNDNGIMVTSTVNDDADEKESIR